MDHGPDRCLVKRLTAEGKGAIGVLKVSGPRSLSVVSQVFRPHHGSSLAETPANRLRVGRIGAGLGDEVVVVWWGNPPEVEIQCHGGRAALALVHQALMDEAGQDAETMSTSASEQTIAEEAADDLMRAPTLRTASILLEQSQGALADCVRGLRAQLLQGDAQSIAVAQATLKRLLQRYELGKRLISGWKIVLAGRPNVGKSRLLNALAGYDRSIVAALEGTTRDIVSVQTAFDGWPVLLSDTAGLRESVDLIEAKGVSLAKESHERADLLLLLLDGSRPLTQDDRSLLSLHPSSLVIRTKSDQPQLWGESTAPALAISAETGDGIAALIRQISQKLVPDPPESGEPIPFRDSHRIWLQEALKILKAEGGVATSQILGAVRLG